MILLLNFFIYLLFFYSFQTDSCHQLLEEEYYLGLYLMQCIHTYFCLCRASRDTVASHPEIPMVASSEVLGITAAAHPQDNDRRCYSLGTLPWIKGAEKRPMLVVHIMHLPQ